MSSKKPTVSIIIRTRNEERWISQCLRGVFDQVYKDFEVVIVDNESTDKTVEKVKQFDVERVIACRDYLPGKALNTGIKQSRGRYIVCLSGHCVPVNDKWLANLIDNFSNEPSVAGVYGRQEPMAFTPDSDKRDLALVFGLDRKVQIKDSFFHNANSVIRKDVWEKMPFDEQVTNIEDRVWAKQILERGYKIIYEPLASVYHYHGIHQNGDNERCSNVVKVLEHIHSDYKYKSIDVEKLNIAALIPVKGPMQYLDGKPLIYYTLKRVFESRYVKEAIVSTDNLLVAKVARKMGAKVPFLRDVSYSTAGVDIAKVYKYSFEKMEENNILPDIVVCLETTFPFRPKGFIDELVLELCGEGLDTVVAARRENKAVWKEKDGQTVQIEEGLTPRQLKDPMFIELRGLGCITHPEYLRRGAIFGEKMGIYEVNDPHAHIEVRSSGDFKMASLLARKFFRLRKNKRIRKK